MGARDRPHVVMGQKAKKPSKGAVKKEKEVEVPEVEEEAYVYPIWATAILWGARIAAIMWILREAYTIRLYAINNYGRVIHEFDPWFNFRATQYLADNGYEKFFHWFDYMSWYPLGRPVGTTIYPGMQMTSVTIWKVMNATGFPMSLNDVCCFVPAWFGVVATTFLGLLTHGCSGSINWHFRRRNHGYHPSAHYAFSWWRLRQRVYRCLCYVHHFLFLVPIPPPLRCQQGFADDWCGRWCCTHLHGCCLGWIRIRYQSDWSSRWHARTAVRLQKGFQRAPTPIILSVLHHRNHRCHSCASGWLDSSKISRADDANARLRRHASPRLRRDSAQEGQPQLLSGSCTACEVRARRGCCRSCHRRYSVPYRLLRTIVISCSWPVCQAHTHRQPSGRLCR